ncbi:hypothetical protein KBY93_14380 [Synechococcus sp. J7-Johnson]|uniref:hypothetical protein n=1 Tax=Synechococcus sp. J7-Johnson TaxID=2823737 RepID=UPI0020CBDE5B|nr:hypothetical protein [Synechococcus sp. J7-Johnson]MCP9841809.1 hypothetical protein [Synechococcus sp. J7-Johnson]
MPEQANKISNPLPHQIWSLIYSRQYDDAMQLLDDLLKSANFGEIVTALIKSVNNLLPNSASTISASSSVSHPTLKGDVLSINNPNQFIFHTNDKTPNVIIDFAMPIDGIMGIYLYNRCQNEEISKRILGCDFFISLDGVEWEKVKIVLDNNQIFFHKGIPIVTSSRFRYLKINRETHGGGTPIHLSQITIGHPLDYATSLVEFMAAIFARKYNLMINEGGKLIEHSSAPDPMQFTIHSISSKELSLEISSIPRFANFVIQITNAIHFARTIGAKSIHIPDTKRVRDLFPVSSKIVCAGEPPITILIGSKKQGVSLQGYFFYRISTSIYSDMPSMRSLVNIFSDSCYLKSKMHNSSLRELTIHIRSGDIFSDYCLVHPGYGQPPCAFYKMSILDYSPEFVTLVYENKLNPVIDEVESFLCASSINFRVQSSDDLREDIQYLTSAKALVISHGTFGIAALCFNRCIEVLYTFNGSFPKGVLPVESEREVVNKVIRDQRGEYTRLILSNNWENSFDQRKLMLQYDEKFLSFE